MATRKNKNVSAAKVRTVGYTTTKDATQIAIELRKQARLYDMVADILYPRKLQTRDSRFNPLKIYPTHCTCPAGKGTDPGCPVHP